MEGKHMSKHLSGTTKSLDMLTSSGSYKKKDFDSKQKSLMNLSIEYRGKKINLDELYNDVLGYSERSVICGMCNKKGTVRKKGNYYEIRHKRSDKETCYIGRNPSEEIIFVPMRILNRQTEN